MAAFTGYSVEEGWVDIPDIKAMVSGAKQSLPGEDSLVPQDTVPTKRLYGKVEEKSVILKSGANTTKEAEEAPGKG